MLRGQPPDSPEIDDDSTEAWEKIPAGRNLFSQRPPILFLEEYPGPRAVASVRVFIHR